MAVAPVTALRSSRIIRGSAVPVVAVGEIVEVHDAHLDVDGMFLGSGSVLWLA